MKSLDEYTYVCVCVLSGCACTPWQNNNNNNKVIRKVRRLGGENDQFQHNRASNAELGIKFYKTSFSTNFGCKLSFILSFLFPNCLPCCHIYFYCSYLYIHYNYSRPCALNAKFQHLILRFNIISLLCGYYWKRGKGVKERVTLHISLIAYN